MPGGDAVPSPAGSAAPLAKSQQGVVAKVEPGIVLIDTAPDFYTQAIREKIARVDAVLYTHTHADHILGIDDLRPYSYAHKPDKLPIYARPDSAAFLRRMYGEGAAVTFWAYHDAQGREAFRVLRIDHLDADGAKAKTYRPCHEGADGRWRISKPGGLLPLYNLPAVLSVPGGGIISVLEGEKCADIAMSLGLTSATTSAHGARAPQLTDWSPLAGRRVVIIRDTLAPVVTMETNYLAGGSDTPAGFPGTAHAQEHMTFRGCQGVTADQIAAIYAQLGGQSTAVILTVDCFFAQYPSLPILP